MNKRENGPYTEAALSSETQRQVNVFDIQITIEWDLIMYFTYFLIKHPILDKSHVGVRES